MSKKCPDCGSLNIEEVFDGESYCKDCFLHCATDDLEDASVFDRITASPEVLGKELVFWGHDKDGEWYTSHLLDEDYQTEAEAIAATVAKLKEVCNEQ